MFFFGLLISVCFDFSHLFPLRIGSQQSRNMKFLFMLDCQGELLEQKTFTQSFVTYFTSKTNNFDRPYYDTCIRFLNGTQIWNKDIGYDQTCLTTIPISEMLKISEEWKMKSPFNNKKFMNLSIVFLHNIKDSEKLQNYINETLKEDTSSGVEMYRFFIVQSPEKKISSLNAIYHVASFKDLKMEDIFYKIFEISEIDLLFTYSNNYFKSTYYITNNVSEMSNKQAKSYCSEMHLSNLPSIETLDEAIYIFQFINNLSLTLNAKSISLHLGLNRQLQLPGFYWDSENVYWLFNNFSNSDPTSCFYINLTFDSKDFQFVKNNVRDFGKRIKSINCNEKLPQTLVLCEYNELHNFHNYRTSPENSVLWSSRQFKFGTKSFAMDRISFLEFMDMVLSSKKYNLITTDNEDVQSAKLCVDPVKICLVFGISECVIGQKYLLGTLEQYACNDGFVNKSDIKSSAEKNKSIFVVSNEYKPMYTFNTLDISRCDSYELCDNKTTSNYSNANFSSDCLDTSKNKLINATCSNQDEHFNFSLEHFQCEIDLNQYFYKCIKDVNGQCQDNSNLQNCENFTCPEPFVKCPNSYCVFPYPNGQFDCPYAEEEFLKGSFVYCEINFIFILKDFCMDLVSFDTLSQIYNQSNFICHNPCPENYRCLSSQIEIKDNSTQTKRSLKLHHSSVGIHQAFGMVFPRVNEYRYFNLFSIVYLNTGICRVNDFDEEFQIWDLKELLILDLSGNNLTHSDKLKSIEHFTKLKKLNLSSNVELIINDNFTFPSSLEIIDLYRTKVHTLRNDVFKNLIYLRYLNLSYTSITRFKDMGIPEYFTLNTLHIEGNRIQNIGIDLFKGLTVNSGLWASDYVICCPIILNINISVDKCHAPFDIISSCKHLVGETLKRIVIWIVGIMTVIGNGIVLAYRIGYNREIFKKAYGPFITGLAMSDFIMGIYLIIIACVDVYYKDVYMLGDFQWRNSILCRFTGFLSTFSSETSTFFICLITLDRYLSITYPFGEHGISSTGKVISIAIIWILGFALALLPVILSDWEMYSSNGLCLALPFSSKQNRGWLFSFIVFVCLNFFLFLLIAFGQIAIFFNIVRIKKEIQIACPNNQVRADDWTVAKKLAMVALTDFCCWFPIGILGFYSLNGYIFDREVYAWIAVFVLPINSALNPIVYTIPALYSKCKGMQ